MLSFGLVCMKRKQQLKDMSEDTEDVCTEVDMPNILVYTMLKIWLSAHPNLHLICNIIGHVLFNCCFHLMQTRSRLSPTGSSTYLSYYQS